MYLFLNSKIIFFIALYLINSFVCDIKKYDVIVIANSNSKLLRQKRVAAPKLDIKEYFIATEIPDIDNFDYSFKSDKDDEIYYDYRKEMTTMRRPLSFDNYEDESEKRIINKLHNLRNNCKALKIRERIQKEALRNNFYNGLPTNQELLVASPRYFNSEAFDFSKEDNYDEAYSDEYKASEGDRIVGGNTVDISLYPYHVGYGSNCGGAIIDKKWILTAGHCGNKAYVKVGSKILNRGERYEIKNHFVHPMWTSRKKAHPFDYDFQLLELAKPLKLSNLIRAVKVGRMSDMVIGKVVTVTGWGNVKENGMASNILRAVRVPIISKMNCQQVQFPYFKGRLTSRMFCAGYKEGGKDACQGDSGGPAVANDRLLGMVSFGYGCATPGSYGVYSKVPKVRNWIEKTTGLSL